MDFVSMLSDPLAMAQLFGAVAVFATVLTVAGPLMADNQMGARLRDVAKRREELRKKNRKEMEVKASSGLKGKNANQVMQDVVGRLRLQERIADDTITSKLQRAGLRGQAAVTTYYFYRFALPIGLAVGAFLYLFVLGFGERMELSMQQRMIIIVGAAVIGFYAPSLYISNRASKRKEAIMRAFPDSLDMLLICVESGMSIELALQRVGTEIATASIELAEELQLTTAELSYLPDRRAAFENLARRTNHPGVKSVAMALIQAERYGTPLGAALRVMAKENRDLRLNEAEKKAAALPAKLTVPMIVFFLPVLFGVIMGPAMIQVMAIMNR